MTSNTEEQSLFREVQYMRLPLLLITGARVLIGSQKPEELAHAIEAALQKA